MLLPNVESRTAYATIYPHNAPWMPAIRAICGRHGLGKEEPRRQELGTHLVYRAGARVVKLFCPLWPGEFAAEKAALLGLRGLPIPEVVATGEIESWPYLIVTALDGEPAHQLWPALSPTQRMEVVRQVGGFMRELHCRPPVQGLPDDWKAFLGERIRLLDDHHRAPAAWRRWLHRTAGSLVGGSRPSVTLNADLTDDHVLLVNRGGRWLVSGVVDFGDAIIGHPLYEIPVPLLCFAGGDSGLARALVESSGERLTPELGDEILAWCLVHHYLKLSDLLARFPAGDPAALREAVWEQAGE